MRKGNRSLMGTELGVGAIENVLEISGSEGSNIVDMSLATRLHTPKWLKQYRNTHI